MYYYLFYLNNCCSWRNDWAVFSLKHVRVLLIHPIFPFDVVIFEQFYFDLSTRMVTWKSWGEPCLQTMIHGLLSWTNHYFVEFQVWLLWPGELGRGGGAASIQISMGTPDYFNYKSCARTVEVHSILSPAIVTSLAFNGSCLLYMHIVESCKLETS